MKEHGSSMSMSNIIPSHYCENCRTDEGFNIAFCQVTTSFMKNCPYCKKELIRIVNEENIVNLGTDYVYKGENVSKKTTNNSPAEWGRAVPRRRTGRTLERQVNQSQDTLF